MASGLGIYVSVPFCRAKCTYCNFASGVFGAERMDAYVDQLCAEIADARARAEAARADLPDHVDTVFFGGGTPSLLSAGQVRRIFEALRREFAMEAEAEITLECAPGQLGEETLDELLRQGLNRVSFGVQSFADREAHAVGRTHTKAMCLDEIARLRTVGIANINVDLIVGLPHQTRASWRDSVDVALQTGVPHVSVYMLEVDEDSRLGREMMAAGERYGAAAAPSEDDVAAWYAEACGWLAAGGVAQYEISNFARPGWESRHNVKYWRREPYLGFGLDAHSMLRTGAVEAVRWANGDELDGYLHSRVSPANSIGLRVLGSTGEWQQIRREQAFEEALFLGLRMNTGIDVVRLRAEFGDGFVKGALAGLAESEDAGLLERAGDFVRLTPAGRMVSNEVFARLLVEA
ncbi:MAG: radical SAM family heme chaperone HemW [Acidobacteriaceae bacterium]